MMYKFKSHIIPAVFYQKQGNIKYNISFKLQGKSAYCIRIGMLYYYYIVNIH